jgi:hypothetical protein
VFLDPGETEVLALAQTLSDALVLLWTTKRLELKPGA